MSAYASQIKEVEELANRPDTDYVPQFGFKFAYNECCGSGRYCFDAAKSVGGTCGACGLYSYDGVHAKNKNCAACMPELLRHGPDKDYCCTCIGALVWERRAKRNQLKKKDMQQMSAAITAAPMTQATPSASAGGVSTQQFVADKIQQLKEEMSVRITELNKLARGTQGKVQELASDQAITIDRLNFMTEEIDSLKATESTSLFTTLRVEESDKQLNLTMQRMELLELKYASMESEIRGLKRRMKTIKTLSDSCDGLDSQNDEDDKEGEKKTLKDFDGATKFHFPPPAGLRKRTTSWPGCLNSGSSHVCFVAASTEKTQNADFIEKAAVASSSDAGSFDMVQLGRLKAAASSSDAGSYDMVKDARLGDFQK
jgi:hypothetical protein